MSTVNISFCQVHRVKAFESMRFINFFSQYPTKNGGACCDFLLPKAPAETLSNVDWWDTDGGV